MNVLITGCTGFVGSHLIKKIIRKHKIFCISTSSGCNNENHSTSDLSINSFHLCEPIDVIIHSAGAFGSNLNFEELIRNNLHTTKNLLEFAIDNKTKKIIFLSSGAVYGYRENVIHEYSRPKPFNYYAISKYYAEKLLINFFSNTIILRLFFPYGPFQKKGIISTITQKIMSNESINIYNNKNNPLINPIYITDLVNVIEYLLESDIKKGIFNIGGLEKTSVYDLANMIGSLLDKKPQFAFVKDKNIKNLYCSSSKLYKEKAISPKVPLKKGIKAFLSLVNDESITSPK